MRFQRILLVAIIFFAFGIFFRFGGLGSMMYSHDEAYTSLRAAGYTGSEAIDNIWDGKINTRDDVRYFLSPSESKDVFDTLSVVARSEPQLSPLYFIFAHYWMRLIGSTPAAMRGLSAFFSLFAIPAMYWLGLELFNSKKIALISAALISLSPFSILLAQDARPYSLWASVTLLSSAAFLTAIRKNTIFNWGIYTLSIIIGIYSHLMFALVIIAQGLYLIVIKESRKEGRFVRYLIVSFLALISFTPWLYQIFIHWKNVLARLGWSNADVSWSRYIQNWLIIVASPVIDLYIGSRNIIPYILRIPVVLIVGYALFYLVVSTSKRIWVFLLLLIGVTALPLLLSDLFRGGTLSIQGRYFASANVAIILVITHLIVDKLSIPREKTPYHWYLITAFLIAAQLGSAFNILMAETWWNKKLSWINPQIVQVLNQDSHPLLIVCQPTPTDLGDVLALSAMVDQDVMFKLCQKPAIGELPSGFSNIYWFHETYKNFIYSENGRQYQATEVVPYFLWRIDNYKP